VVSASGTTNIRRAANELVKPIKLLNSFGLERNSATVTAGVLAAFLAIAYYEEDVGVVEDFVRGIHAARYLPRLKADVCIAEFHEFHEVRRATKTCSGTANVDSIRDTCLTMLVDYKRLSLNPRARRLDYMLTLGGFAELYKTKAA
jgi:hypothetical protein